MERENRVISVVIPAFNEESSIRKVYSELSGMFSRENIEYELIIVDDGSEDQSLKIIEKICAENDRVRALSFSRNFGKEGAIFAGLHFSRGGCAVVFDCDLQFPPETILEMYRLWLNNDLHIIDGRKNRRQDESAAKRFFAGLYYYFLKKSSGLDLKKSSDFKLLDRSVIDLLNDMPERNTFFRAISGWVGFNTETVFFDVAKREAGKTKWSFIKLFRLALSSVTSFTTLPMHIVTFFGTGFFVFALVLTVQSIYMKLSGRAVEGFTTVIILLLIIGSIIMISLGIIGVYLAKIYEEVKHRPRYIVKRTINIDGKNGDNYDIFGK